MKKIIFKRLSQTEYDNINVTTINDYSSDSVFGYIDIDDKEFKFSWKSELVNPIIKMVNNHIFGVGIDLNFSLIDCNKKTLVLNVDLHNFFIDFILVDKYIYVATELDIIIIDIKDFKIITEYQLPEIFDYFNIEDSIVKVFCIDKQIVNINLN